MTARLTRRERAAMQLAIEALRADGPPETVLTDALVVLGVAEDGGARLCGAIEIAAQRARWPLTMPGYQRRERAVRARLALYLRARLRADRGEDRHRVGPCSACDGSGIGDYARDPSTGEWTASRCCEVCDGHGHLFRITPLWQLAPAHGMWRHPCADGRPADLPRGEACGVCGASEPRRARR